MLGGSVVTIAALLYLAALFAIASYGDRVRPAWMTGRARPLIYGISIAVYCTSWTFFGSVGFAVSRGYDFLTIYVGPLLLFALGLPLLLKVVRLAKAQNITSIADFIAARYGKSQSLGAFVSVAAVLGTVPYIALQLKAIAASLQTVLSQADLQGLMPEIASDLPVFGDLALVVALLLAVFAILFGTRHVEATEHQDGLMLAIAAESLVKLVAFLVVGAYVTFGLFDGPGDLIAKAAAAGKLAPFETWPRPDVWIAMTLIAFFCALLLPRQFHVMVVESRGEAEVARSAWIYPVYLIAINIFVIPIALAGMVLFDGRGIDGDVFVLALPLEAGHAPVALFAFVGGLSAATAMVIVETVALAIMISNNIVMPLALRGRDGEAAANMRGFLLSSRRVAIFALLVLAYAYHRVAGDSQLVAMGLLSFAAVAQFAPAFFGGLAWRRGTARGATAGLAVGFAVWVYTLLLPSFAASGLVPQALIAEGPFGLAWLRPQSLFGIDIDPLAHGVFWSLGLNLAAYVLLSLARGPSAIERLQATSFVDPGLAPMAQSFRLWRSAVSVGDLMTTVGRYLGEERTRAAFEGFAQGRGGMLDPRAEADIHLLRFGEHILASAIGAASSRLVLSLLLRRRNVSTRAALQLIDDASAAIQYSRDLLQTALDEAKQGISVVDKDLQLVCWNRAFGDLFDLPPELLRVGVGLEEIVRFNAHRGLYGPQADPDAIVAERLEALVTRLETTWTRLHTSGRVLEIRSARMPDGGVVTTYSDITETVEAQEALERANETLERRVRERTAELMRLNEELGQAKAAADEANISKTRFLAAASHDILQPLNAARLYTTSLVERLEEGPHSALAHNVDASLDAVEEILSALLDISRLDAGALKPELSSFRIDEVLRQLELEFGPLARERGLRLTFMPSSLTVRSDRRLLRRLLQNLVSNAIKYTVKGRVLVGCRRRRGRLLIEVLDTGLGIPAAKQKAVFKEFQRLEQGARVARGLGLGLSIVERVARVLDHPLTLRSSVGRGTAITVEVPVAVALPAAEPLRATAAAAPSAFGDMLVLCIDNEAKIVDGMATLLAGWGCKVITASGLTEAIQALKRRRAVPDLVLVDYHLDEGTGLDAVTQLRWRIADDIPAILITADRSPEVAQAAQAKHIHVLHKPLRPAALRALMARTRRRPSAAE